MTRGPHCFSQLVGAAIPYVAVLLGLYWLQSVWASILFYHAGIVAFLAVERRWRVWPRMFTGLNGKALTVLGVVCALVGPVVYTLWPWIHSPEWPLREWLAHYGLEGWSWLPLIAYFSTVNPFLEELHWRSLLPFGQQLSWIDFAFAGYHVLVVWLLLNSVSLLLAGAVLVVASWGWRVVGIRFGGLAVPLVTHALADASVVLAAYMLVSP